MSTLEYSLTAFIKHTVHMRLSNFNPKYLPWQIENLCSLEVCLQKFQEVLFIIEENAGNNPNVFQQGKDKHT